MAALAYLLQAHRVSVDSLLLKMAIETVDVPMKNGHFPWNMVVHERVPVVW